LIDLETLKQTSHTPLSFLIHIKIIPQQNKNRNPFVSELRFLFGGDGGIHYAALPLRSALVASRHVAGDTALFESHTYYSILHHAKSRSNDLLFAWLKRVKRCLIEVKKNKRCPTIKAKINHFYFASCFLSV